MEESQESCPCKKQRVSHSEDDDDTGEREHVRLPAGYAGEGIGDQHVQDRVMGPACDDARVNTGDQQLQDRVMGPECDDAREITGNEVEAMNEYTSSLPAGLVNFNHQDSVTLSENADMNAKSGNGCSETGESMTVGSGDENDMVGLGAIKIESDRAESEKRIDQTNHGATCSYISDEGNLLPHSKTTKTSSLDYNNPILFNNSTAIAENSYIQTKESEKHIVKNESSFHSEGFYQRRVQSHGIGQVVPLEMIAHHEVLERQRTKQSPPHKEENDSHNKDKASEERSDMVVSPEQMDNSEEELNLTDTGYIEMFSFPGSSSATANIVETNRDRAGTSFSGNGSNEGVSDVLPGTNIRSISCLNAEVRPSVNELHESSSRVVPTDSGSKLKIDWKKSSFKLEARYDCQQSDRYSKPPNVPFLLDASQIDSIVSSRNINSLPSSILVNIFGFFSSSQLLRQTSLVCKYWYNFCRDPDLWREINLKNQHKLTDRILQQLLLFSDRVLKVNLTDCRFVSNVGIQALVVRCRHIHTLKLMRCFDLTDAAFVDLVEKGLCKQLHSLHVDGCCKITDKTILEVAGACPRLRSLHLNQCTKVTDISILSLARQCPRLTQLLLDHCHKVTDVSITEIVIGCPNLTYLNIMSCGVTDTGVKLLSKLSYLTNLDLSNIPRLTTEAVIYVSRYCKLLECINISLNSVMDDNCVKELARNLPRLQRLYCVSCSVTDTGLENIAKYRPTLEALDVGWCQDITDIGVRVISLTCTHLDYFGLIRCDKVSIETIEELVLKYPNVNYSTFMLESRRLFERARREGFQFSLPLSSSS